MTPAPLESVPRVVVVGAGVAGTAAAVRAARSGADVTLIEGSTHPPRDKSLLPYLLSNRYPKDLLASPAGIDLRDHSVDLRSRERVEGVDLEGRLVRTGDVELHFDSLVIATGSEYVSELPKGFSKKGAFVMRSIGDYLSLSESLPSLSHVVLAGPAPIALRAASELSGTRVSVFLGRNGLRRFSAGVHDMVVEAARSRGVEILEAGLESVVGMRRVEAVISEGSVLGCDAAVLFPNSRPAPPTIDCLVGSHGGLVVDRSMRTSSRGVFAAGDCAELRVGEGSFPFRLHSSALVMGDTAGQNAAGGSVSAGLSGIVAFDLFGLEVCTAGLSTTDARSLGLDVTEVEGDERVKSTPFGDETELVSITFEKGTRRIYGIQAAGAGIDSEYVSAVVSRHLTLEEVVNQESAYLPHFNRDVSPIRLTAAKALAGR